MYGHFDESYFKKDGLFAHIYTVAPRYNAVVGVHDFGPHCMRGALGVPISATRELLNNSDRRPLQPNP